MSTRFICPECGSYMFGSTQNSDGTLTRHCHGNEAWNCKFNFHQKEDEKYFHAECEHCQAETNGN